MKNIINILSEKVINQIAAGEVIQRPASIVKELIENSIDAEAKNININIENAGKKIVQIIDDGKGMIEEDAKICFQKHTTSKIKETNDISQINTMGFRGEALASIGSIAEVELKTKIENDEIGTLINIDNSKIKKIKKIATSKGTSVTVKNLFFNVPARKNFLKSDIIENKHILETFIQLAIAHYHIGFKLIMNEKTVHNLSPTNLKQRIIQLFGKKYKQKILPVKEQTTIVKIEGFIVNPTYARKTRGEQFLYVNNRFIKSSYLNHAIKNAMTNMIHPDQYPSFFIFLTINPNNIDVNIHPNKIEVKFEDEKAIYQILKSTCKKSMGMFNIAPSLDFSLEETFEVPIEMQKSIPKEPKLKINFDFNPFKKDDLEARKNTKIMEELFFHQPKDDLQHNLDIIKNSMYFDDRYALFSLLVDEKLTLNLIDKKRAFERIIYEKTYNILKDQKRDHQKLIEPWKIEINSIDLEVLKENREIIESLGYKIDKIINNTVIVNSIPSGLEGQNLQELFEFFLEELKNKNDDVFNNFIEKIAKKEAYYASNKRSKYNLSQHHDLKSFINILLKCKMPFMGINGKPCVIHIEPNLLFN